LGALAALATGKRAVAAVLLSASAALLFISSRIALDWRREAVLTLGQWVIQRLPDSSAEVEPLLVRAD
jgi:hypothetical protein